MYPLLRPGSFVQIDSHATRTPAADWQTEFDRPIYFVELRDGDACAWCEMRGAQITLIPHPLSAFTDTPVRIPKRSGNHRAGDGRRYAPTHEGRAASRRSATIAKASLKFEQRNSEQN